MKHDLTSLEVFKLKENHQFDAELSIIDRSAACYIVIQLVWQSPYFRQLKCILNHCPGVIHTIIASVPREFVHPLVCLRPGEKHTAREQRSKNEHSSRTRTKGFTDAVKGYLVLKILRKHAWSLDDMSSHSLLTVRQYRVYGFGYSNSFGCGLSLTSPVSRCKETIIAAIINFSINNHDFIGIQANRGFHLDAFVNYGVKKY